jgi:WD40 repeat protein
VPSFFDRAYLIARGARGEAGADIGPEPRPTYGCNWVAVHPSRDEIAVTHDDGRVRVRDAERGELLRTLGPDTDSLYMGAAFHPTLPRLATVDFYGELLVYESDTGRVLWRRDLGFGPGISVDWSPDGEFLAVGGYAFRGRLLRIGEDGLPVEIQELDAPNRGVVKSLAFAGPSRLLVASGDGTLVVHDRQGDRFLATKAIRGTPHMELSNGVAASPDGRVAYVVSRDQSLRAFDLESGAELARGLAHVRGVKAVHVSECGRHLATGSYETSPRCARSTGRSSSTPLPIPTPATPSSTTAASLAAASASRSASSPSASPRRGRRRGASRGARSASWSPKSGG